MVSMFCPGVPSTVLIRATQLELPLVVPAAPAAVTPLADVRAIARPAMSVLLTAFLLVGGKGSASSCGPGGVGRIGGATGLWVGVVPEAACGGWCKDVGDGTARW